MLRERFLRVAPLDAKPPDVGAHNFNKVIGHPGWLERTASSVHGL